MKIVSFDFPLKIRTASSSPLLKYKAIDSPTLKLCEKMIKIIDGDSLSKLEELKNQIIESNLIQFKRIFQSFINQGSKISQAINKKAEEIANFTKTQYEGIWKKRKAQKLLIIQNLSQKLKQKEQQLEKTQEKLATLIKNHNSWSMKEAKKQILKHAFEDCKSTPTEEEPKKYLFCHSIDIEKNKKPFFMTHQTSFVKNHNKKIITGKNFRPSMTKKDSKISISTSANKFRLSRSFFPLTGSSQNKENIQNISSCQVESQYSVPKQSSHKNSIVSKVQNESFCNQLELGSINSMALDILN